MLQSLLNCEGEAIDLFTGIDSLRLNVARQKPQTLYFLGMRLYCSATKLGRFKVGFLTERTRLNRFLNKLKEQMSKWRHLPLRDQSQLINRRLVGHFHYNAIVSNYPAIKHMYYEVPLY